MSETDLVGMRKMMGEFGDQMSPHLVRMLETDWTAEDFTRANMWRKSVVNRMARFMTDHPRAGHADGECGRISEWHPGTGCDRRAAGGGYGVAAILRTRRI
jgi:hypothetical protein